MAERHPPTVEMPVQVRLPAPKQDTHEPPSYSNTRRGFTYALTAEQPEHTYNMDRTHVGMGEATALPTGTLTTFTGNPRRGDIATIKDSLETNGQFRPIVVNRGTHTHRPNEVLAGNHTLMAARELGWETIDCYVVDVDHDSATKIVLADNRTGDLSEYDDRLLLDLLRELDDTTGTGYNDDDVAYLIALEEQNKPTAAPQPTHNAPEPEEQGNTHDGTHDPANSHTQPYEGDTTTPPDDTQEAPQDPEPTRELTITFPAEQFHWVQQALKAWHHHHPEADNRDSTAIHTLLTQATA